MLFISRGIFYDKLRPQIFSVGATANSPLNAGPCAGIHPVTLAIDIGIETLTHASGVMDQKPILRNCFVAAILDVGTEKFVILILVELLTTTV